MRLEIITPEKDVYQGEVELINLPGSDGSFGLLDGHAPLISTLKEGEIKIVENGNEQTFSVKGGVVEVNNNKVIVLAE
jgi:F-type H+-transporting ATPase subunit epsilon